MKVHHTLLLALLALQNLGAATLTVTSTADSGAGSLRAALAAAASGDTINFSLVMPASINLTSGELLVDKSVSILGPGPNNLAVNGNAASRVFHTGLNAVVIISGLTITNGAVDNGGGIYDIGSTLTVSNCVLRGNLAVDSAGALYAFGGTVNIVNCTLAGNTVTSGGVGGAIYSSGCTLTIFDSTISGNSNSNGFGGAIYTDGGGTPNGGFATITGCTISSNYAGMCGGVENDGTYSPVVMIIENSTLSGNSALSVGAIYNAANFGDSPFADLSIFNSTLSGNSAPDVGGIYFDGPDFSGQVHIGNTILNAGDSGVNIAGSFSAGVIDSLGFNLSSDDGGGLLTGASVQLNTNPKLGPLQDNGGPTWTHALLPGSPAIDKGKNVSGSAYDQRGAGFARTVDDPGVPNAAGGNGTDIGAFEVQRTLPPVAICKNVTVLAGPGGSANASIDNGSFDPYGDTLTLSQSPPGPYPIGTNEVTLTVIDSQGVSNSCTDLVIVRPRTLIVSNTHDSGPGSLREALAPGVDGEMIDATGVSGTILLTSGELLVTNSMSILGPGPNNLVVDGNNASRVIHIGRSITANISGLTITNGFAANSNGFAVLPGGGIYNDRGTLTVSNCLVSVNHAGLGGGIYSDGTGGGGATTVVNSILSYNRAGEGGGIYNLFGALLIANCTLANNSAGANSSYPSGGGGIHNEQGTLTIANSTLTENFANGGGGGILNHFASPSSISDSTITLNFANDGGGIFNDGSALALTGSTVRFNTASSGAGIFSEAAGGLGASLSLTNVTVSENSVTLYGGGLYNYCISSAATAAVAIVNCTFSGNIAHTSGGGIFSIREVGSTSILLGSSILNAGSAGANIYDGFGNVVSLGYNLSSDYAAGYLTNATDQINTDPKLDFLWNNGGPTFTYALLPGSPAIDQGKNFSGSATDQRGPGFARTSDDPAIPNAAGGDGTDIGAVEVQYVPPPLPPVAVIHVSPLLHILPADTHLYVLAPNNTQATVQLDGSSSSHPANLPLQFTWYADGQSNVLASGAVPAAQLPVGPHTVTLSVNDGLLTGNAQVQFEIITPGSAVDQLQALVSASTLARKHKEPLLQILGVANKAYDRGNFHQGSEVLELFESQVHQRVAPVDATLASQLTAASQLILSTVGDNDHDHDGHNHHETEETHEKGNSDKGH